MTFAQFIGSGTTGIVGAINLVVVPFIAALAFLVFVWGVLNYFFLHGGEDTKREEGRQFILWGILGLVLLFSIWGVVNILLSTLGLTPGASSPSSSFTGTTPPSSIGSNPPSIGTGPP